MKRFFLLSFIGSLTLLLSANTITYTANAQLTLSSAKFTPVFTSHTFANGVGTITFDNGDVTAIGNEAFESCTSMTSITIPNSVKSIGNSAFWNCYSLVSVVLPDSLTSIGASLFEYCEHLSSLTIPNSVKSIGDYAFDGCTSLTSMIIPDSVTSMGEGVFYKCYALAQVSLPKLLKKVANDSFYKCTALSSIVIPDLVKSIGVSAFMNCSSLTSVTIPSPVTTIDDCAFYYCSSLTSIACYAVNPPQLGCCVFSSATTSAPLYVLCGRSAAYSAASGWSAFSTVIDSLSFSFSVTSSDTVMGQVSSVPLECNSFIISATPNYGYHFNQWSDGNTDITRTINLTNNTKLVAQFARNSYTLTTSSASEHGTTMGDTTALYLDTLTIFAIPDTGYHFVQWSDGVTDNTRTIVLTSDTAFVAEFVSNLFYLTTTPDLAEHGTTMGDTIASYMDTLTICATPHFGYYFTQWSDGITDNPRTIVIIQDTAFVAEFAKNYSGFCGYQLQWSYTDSMLAISGSGEMYDYIATDVPWLLLRDSITRIEICDAAMAVGDYAFFECIAVTSITCLATVPPYAGRNCFYGVDRSIPLYVPAESIEDYRATAGWEKFYNILPIETSISHPDGTDERDSARKMLKNGRLLILRHGVTYDATGTICQ